MSDRQQFMPLSEQEIDSIADALATKLAAKKMTGNAKLIDRVELSKRIGLSIPTIERLLKSKLIPCVDRRAKSFVR